MPKGDTTIQVSQRVLLFVQKNSRGNESVDSTLKRILGMAPAGHELPKKANGRTLIKVSRSTKDRLVKEAREGESRNDTLERLLGLSKRNSKKSSPD